MSKLTKDNVVKIPLGEEHIPRKWYNIVADMPTKPSPYFSPRTGEIVTPEEMSAIFPPAILEQEMTAERWIDIPDEVREMYKSWRPSPLIRARKLEKALGTPARIYYKYEGTNATGSHKLNSSLAQAFYNKQAGMKRLATETGAGQWGSALSMACSHFELECTVYMVKVSYEQKPYRKSFMQTFGAEIFSSPTDRTNAGRAILAEHPDTTGSLGIAISEAVEDAATHDDTNYALGSVLNHVCLHQTVIGQEAKLQLESIDEYPDVIYGCHGGGSNFAGISFPFLYDKIQGKSNVKAVAIEPSACPSLTKGKFAFDYGDTAKMAPIAKMYTLGHDFVPAGIHAGGLRYHGAAPLVSQLLSDGLISADSCGQTEAFDAAVLFARTEGIVPAPESSHAVFAAVNDAKKCAESGEEKVILFNLSGHGYFDMSAYESYFADRLEHYEYPEEEIKKSMANLPKVPM
jgi:tryptophan synthase beta chain